MPRGGYRIGAGRKALGDRRDVTLAGVRISRAKLEAYHQAAASAGITLTAWVEKALDREAARGNMEER
jgi:hypothetical protein